MSEKRPNVVKRLLKPSHPVVLLVELAVVFALGYMASHLLGRPAAPAEAAGDAHDHAAQPTAQMWTCSMHPQIKKDKPGQCPICGMDLIPVSSHAGPMTGLRQLVVSPESRALMNIQVTPVERRYVEAEVRMVGKVDYDETRLKHITAWVPGRLDRLFVDYTGVRVNEGDHMVYIYSEELYAAQQELIEAARTRRESSSGTDRGLFSSGGIDLLESSREKLRLWGLTAQQIAEIEQRDKPSDHMMIYAPIGGIVIAKLKQEGDRVDTGERIYTVADLTRLWVRMDAYESDLMWLRYGQQVTFTTEAYPGEEFVGRIAFIDPVLNDRTRTVKVRVNIENPQGKLKPDMFVRGVVKAKVAAGGRVIDADLVGKWISPMHPEIVKDEPGKCDICGMPLVRAETLGYVAAEAAGLAKPLVIPVSAALLTGTRAIVYVEDPQAKEPTFEGREIVLGPRAGDYYLVREGLGDGELVVTSGNFKIDSALQILARPSMMTPEGGGGGGGGHQHGGESSKPQEHAGHAGGAPAESPPPVMDLPISVRQKLHDIESAAGAIAAVVKDEDLAAAREEFAALGRTVDAVDASLLKDHSQMVWKELGMLLANDAAEGGELSDLTGADRILQSLRRHVQRLDEQFGLSRAAPLPSSLDVPPEFQSQLASLWSTYLRIGETLAADDFTAGQDAVAQFTQAFHGVEMALLTDQQVDAAWMKEAKNLETISAALTQAEDIASLREQFAPLSGVMQVLALSFGFGDDQPVYLLHCPMAFDNRGAGWLQRDDQTRNPYFGAAMLKCEDRAELIAGGAPRVESPESSNKRGVETHHGDTEARRE